MQRLCILLLVAVVAVSTYEIEVIRSKAFRLAESPHWDGGKQELYFVDNKASKVHRYIPSSDQLYEVALEGSVSPVIPVAGSPNDYFVGVDQEFKILEWDGISHEPTNLTTIEVVNEGRTTNLNDGKCDASGRILIGTYDAILSSLANFYRFDSDGTLTLLQDQVTISNGLAWSADNKTLYYIDSPTLHVDAFDYDIVTGSISNRRSIFYLPDHGKNEGTPDGMTIDSDGNLWVAVFGGWEVLHINPLTGELLSVIDFHDYASQITSLAFGGPNLDVLFVTSGDLLVNDPFSGSLFAVNNLGVTGAGPGVPFIKNF